MLPAAPATTTALKSSLKRVLTAPSKATLATLAAGGFRYQYVAAEPGKLTLSWYRAGIKVATAPTVTITKAGPVTLTLTLTAAGRRAKANTKTGGWSVSASASFTPTAPAGAGTVTATKLFTLH